MYLRYYLNENGERQYTLSVVDPKGKPTLSAHPGLTALEFYEIVLYYLAARVKRRDGIVQNYFIKFQHTRFSPEDKYSRQRITIKKRFGLLLTQQPEPVQ